MRPAITTGTLPVVDMHPGQLTVTPQTARALVDEQFPAWRDLPVRAVSGHGTTNAIYRIGERFAARFPLEAADPDATRKQLDAEAENAAELLGRTRFATPEPVALGEPGAGYPLPWSVQTWLPGTPATSDDLSDSVDFAHDVAEFIAGVRSIDTRGRTFSGSGRGGELPAHDEWLEVCFQHSDGLLDVPALRRMWAALRELPSAAADGMTHGDLIPGNLLVSGGHLTAVIDVGGLGAADPALDLVAAWHFLEPTPRKTLRADLDCDDVEWERGKAWAFQQAMGLVWYYAESNPPMSLLGRRTLDRILADGQP